MLAKAQLIALAVAACAAAADFPQAEITNGVVTLQAYLPDAERGYYRGTRFDWSGQVGSLKTLGHDFFGQWFDKYDPKLHDSIMGPVEEFLPSIGYNEAKPGETFVRIGVGSVRKPQESEYTRFKTYDIVDAGKWSVTPGKDRIEFVHQLNAPNGYAYRYTKTLLLPPGKPQLVIEHSLENTGAKRISTAQYNHNFFVIDGKPTGPGVRVEFPFAVHAAKPLGGSQYASVEGNVLTYKQELPKGESVYGEFAGGTPYRFLLEHAPAGAAVRIEGDRPISKLVYWSIRTTFCPEAYIDIDVEPGKTMRWTYTYEFMTLGKR